MQGRTPRLLALLLAGGLSIPTWATSPLPRQPLTDDARHVFHWIERSKDNGGLPFMIIDKRQAHVWVFDGEAGMKGDAPVLLGSARGDHTVPGIGDLPLSRIKPSERTTPAGRFQADIGRNLRGETVVWVDYDAAVSMHPVLTTERNEKREQRLATPTPADNRVSYGCINVPKAFHETIVLGTVQRGPTVVYVLPEARPLRSVFTQLDPTAANSATRRSITR